VYKIFGFKPDEKFGRVAEVEFSIPAEGSYAYLLGSFNAFNEGSFRMRRKGDRWTTRLNLPEGVWRYGFSVDGEFLSDPENPRRERYRRLSYKFERETSVAVIRGPGRFFHRPSATYLYSIAGRTHVLLRTRLNWVEEAAVVLGDESFPMERKAGDELFEYFEATLPEKGEMKYHFEIWTKEGGIRTYGPFVARPYKPKVPGWVFSRVFYQIIPDRFDRGLPGRPRGRSFRGERFYGGDLTGIIKRLDHIEDLGVNALYLTPIFESMTYHRYDVLDYFRIDEKLGGYGVFRGLVKALQRRNVKLILDGVFHHTSFFHPYFQDLLKRGEESEYRDFYRVTGFPVVPEEFLRVLNSEEPWEEKYKKLKSFKWNYESFYSVWLMPRLNHENPEVMDFVRKVMNYWLERGADGWRLDVAHGVPPEFWREIRESMPINAYLIGEVMDDARLWLFDKFHGTMNYPLYEAILRFFGRREIEAEEFLAYLELLSVHLGPAEYSMYNFLDNHDTERFLDIAGSPERYLCALAFLMTYKGIPSILYGDEIGLRGNGEGLSAGRSPMIWNPEEWNMDILGVTKTLIRLRKGSRALQVGAFRPIKFEGGFLLYERIHGEERVLIAINYSHEPKELKLPVRYSKIAGRGSVTLHPWSFVILASKK